MAKRNDKNVKLKVNLIKEHNRKLFECRISTTTKKMLKGDNAFVI